MHDPKQSAQTEAVPAEASTSVIAKKLFESMQKLHAEHTRLLAKYQAIQKELQQYKSLRGKPKP